MPKPIRFLCVCSGLSAPSAAWKPRGWQAVAYAEIDPFASAVLAHRHGAGRPRFMPQPDDTTDPDEASRRRSAIKALASIEWGTLITNEGDFTRLRDEPMIVEADVLVGGTPCQGFSLAGLRGSLSDDRSNLCLEFIRLADAIDDLRRDAGKPPVAILWENVPGVLSTGDNAFGAFLGGMVGAQSPLIPPGRGRWTSSGVVAGPDRVAAWRTMDAQHFGLPQRRRRVFVLARRGAGALRVADALLPIIDSMCGHSPPSRKAQEDFAGDAGGRAPGAGGEAGGAERRGVGSAGGGRGDRDGSDRGRPLRVEAFGGNRQTGPLDVATARLAHGGAHGHQDFETETFVVEEVAPALTARPYRDGGADDSGLILSEPMPFDPTQITHPENRSRPMPGDPAPTLARGGHPPAIAFNAREELIWDDDVAGALSAGAPQSQAVAYVSEVSPPLLAGTASGMQFPGAGIDTAESLIVHAPEIAGPILATSLHGGARSTDTESGALVVNFEHGLAPHGSLALKDIADEIGASEAKNHSAILEAQAFSMRGRDGENMIEPELGGVAPAIRTGGGGSDKPFVAMAFQERRRPEGITAEFSPDISYALTSPNGGGRSQERLIPVAFKPSHYTRDKDGAPSDLAPPLSADADKGDQDPIVLQEEAKAFTVSGQSNGFAWESDVNPALLAHRQSETSALQYGVRIGAAVRRLTPRECERLQGFEDDFTLIPYSDAHRSDEDLAQTVEYLIGAGYGDNEAAALATTPDGPRYRSLGNSMAVDVIEELGARIEWLLEGDA